MTKRTASRSLVLFAALGISVAAAAQSFQVSGTVVNGDNGSPVARCQVMIQPSGAQQREGESVPGAKTFTTREDGRFLFDNVAPGKYSLVARRNGYRAQTLNEHDGFSSAVVVGPNKDSQNIIFRLKPAASIAGKITDEFGDAVSSAQVSLFRRGPLLGKSITYLAGRSNTDPQGVFHFYRLSPGEYFIVVIARPWYAAYRQFTGFQPDAPPPPARPPSEANVDLTFPVTYYAGAVDAASATPIKLRPGERFVADMRLASQPAAAFKMELPGADDTKPAQAPRIEASIFGTELALEPTVQTISNGKLVEYAGVPPGEYTLKEVNVGAEPGSEQTRKQLEITADGSVDYKKTADATPITGRVELFGIEGPLKPTIIWFNKDGGPRGIPVRPNANGEFTPFRLFPGTYEYSANSGQGVIKSFTAKGAKVTGRTIDIGTEPVEVTVTLADVAVEVTGIVRGPDGKPFPGAMVVIIPDDPDHNQNIFRRDQSDLDGTFSLRVVMPGKYSLVAIADGWDLEWAKLDVMRRFIEHGTPVQITPSQDASFDITVQSARE